MESTIKSGVFYKYIQLYPGYLDDYDGRVRNGMMTYEYRIIAYEQANNEKYI